MELSIENVAWFAGLFEGEGCISPDYQKDIGTYSFKTRTVTNI